MIDNLYEDIEEYRVVMPKVSIMRKKSIEANGKDTMLDIFNSIKKKQLLPIVKMSCSPVQLNEVNKNSLSVDLRKSKIKSFQTQSPENSKNCLLPRKEYQRILNSKKIREIKDLSIIGNVVNNKDWVSMILCRSSFLSTQEKSKNFHHNLNIKLNKSVSRVKKINKKVFRGRCLAYPHSTMPLNN